MTMPVRAGSGGGDLGDAEIDLRVLLGALWRHRARIAGFVLLMGLGTLCVLLNLTTLYSSEARLIIESRETGFTRPLQIQEREQLDERAVASQVQVLLSGDIARGVVRKLGLTNKQGFDRPASLLGSLPFLRGVSDGPGRPAEERAAEILQKNLEVYQLGQTRVIAVVYSSPDRQLAADVANAVVDSYIQAQGGAKLDATRAASTWLSGEIDVLRGRVENAEQKVEAFRTENGLLLGPNNTSLASQRLSELNAQLGQAQARRSEAASKAELIRGMLRTGAPIDSLAEVMSSPLIQRLREQQVTLNARLAEYSTTYLPAHPRLREAKAQLGDLDRQIRAEAEKIARGLEGETSVTEAREASFRDALDALKRDAGQLNGQEVELRALEREARAQRDLLEAYLGRYRDASARDSSGSLAADARIVSRAVAPRDPSFPKIVPMMVATLLASLLIAIGAVTTIELFSGTTFVRRGLDPRTAGELLGQAWPTAAIPVLPDVSRAEQTAWAREVVSLVESAVAGGDPRGITLLVAGSGTDVPSAAATLELADILNKRDRRVVVVDLERSAGLSKLSGLAARAGLTDLVAGRSSFAEVLHRADSSRVHVVPAGLADAEAELNRPRLDIVMDALSHAYEVVVSHAGPASAIPVGSRPRAGVLVALICADADPEGSTAETMKLLGEAGYGQVLAVIAPALPERPAPQLPNLTAAA